jgi:hypothetical protein
MYNRQYFFSFDVKFSAVPIFYKKIRIARAGKIFWPQKKSGIYFSGRKKYQHSGLPGSTNSPKCEMPACPPGKRGGHEKARHSTGPDTTIVRKFPPKIFQLPALYTMPGSRIGSAKERGSIMTEPSIITPAQGHAPETMKIPLAVHLAGILLLVAVTATTGPLAAFFV